MPKNSDASIFPPSMIAKESWCAAERSVGGVSSVGGTRSTSETCAGPKPFDELGKIGDGREAINSLLENASDCVVLIDNLGIGDSMAKNIDAFPSSFMSTHEGRRSIGEIGDRLIEGENGVAGKRPIGAVCVEPEPEPGEDTGESRKDLGGLEDDPTSSI
ncbi:hypothetical protein DFH11DRAFT_1581508 [Phellopilus nigrolimitatus]|nr:hypothetical protein DFH11DRAFT_1581508 [Phellopilus nigrolimitatus]